MKIFLKKHYKKLIAAAVLLIALITLLYLNSGRHKYSDIYSNGMNISTDVKKIKFKKTKKAFNIYVSTPIDIEQSQAEDICRKFRNLSLKQEKENNIGAILKGFGKTKPEIIVSVDVGDDGIYDYSYTGSYSDEISSEYIGDKYNSWEFKKLG